VWAMSLAAGPSHMLLRLASAARGICGNQGIFIHVMQLGSLRTSCSLPPPFRPADPPSSSQHLLPGG
jgi:hypothetical protein